MTHPPHATDDKGFPLNSSCCEVCMARSLEATEAYLARVLSGNLTPSAFEGFDDWAKQ